MLAMKAFLMMVSLNVLLLAAFDQFDSDDDGFDFYDRIGLGVPVQGEDDGPVLRAGSNDESANNAIKEQLESFWSTKQRLIYNEQLILKARLFNFNLETCGITVKPWEIDYAKQVLKVQTETMEKIDSLIKQPLAEKATVNSNVNARNVKSRTKKLNDSSQNWRNLQQRIDELFAYQVYFEDLFRLQSKLLTWEQLEHDRYLRSIKEYGVNYMLRQSKLYDFAKTKGAFLATSQHSFVKVEVEAALKWFSGLLLYLMSDVLPNIVSESQIDEAITSIKYNKKSVLQNLDLNLKSLGELRTHKFIGEEMTRLITDCLKQQEIVVSYLDMLDEIAQLQHQRTRIKNNGLKKSVEDYEKSLLLDLQLNIVIANHISFVDEQVKDFKKSSFSSSNYMQVNRSFLDALRVTLVQSKCPKDVILFKVGVLKKHNVYTQELRELVEEVTSIPQNKKASSEKN